MPKPLDFGVGELDRTFFKSADIPKLHAELRSAFPGRVFSIVDGEYTEAPLEIPAGQPFVRIRGPAGVRPQDVEKVVLAHVKDHKGHVSASVTEVERQERRRQAQVERERQQADERARRAKQEKEDRPKPGGPGSNPASPAVPGTPVVLEPRQRSLPASRTRRTDQPDRPRRSGKAAPSKK